jgi:viroplasmin and RNaseH domain-containing protein
VISNSDPTMINNLKIKAIEPNLETTTDENGEFVLYFKNMKNKDITIEISKDILSKKVSTSLDEGKTRSIGKIMFP